MPFPKGRFTEVPTAQPARRNFVIQKKAAPAAPPPVVVVEEKVPDEGEEPAAAGGAPGKGGVSTGSQSFSYKEFKQTAESKIEKELREMREREEELK